MAIVLPICYLLGQEDLRSSTYQAYLDSNIDKWETALNEDQVKPLSLESQYDRAIAIFGYAGLCIDSKEKKRAKAYVHELHDITSELLNQQPQNPKIMGIHAASLGFKLIYQPHKMMKLGHQSVRLMEAARKIDDRCPEVLVQLGNQSWVMPRVFGGDKEEAMHYYRLAITHLEKNQEQIVENWHYIKMQMGDRANSSGTTCYSQFITLFYRLIDFDIDTIFFQVHISCKRRITMTYDYHIVTRFSPGVYIITCMNDCSTSSRSKNRIFGHFEILCIMELSAVMELIKTTLPAPISFSDRVG